MEMEEWPDERVERISSLVWSESIDEKVRALYSDYPTEHELVMMRDVGVVALTTLPVMMTLLEHVPHSLASFIREDSVGFNCKFVQLKLEGLSRCGWLLC
jgi:hypothetical protein